MSSEHDIRTIAASAYFDGDWYQKTYPDSTFSELEPAAHYLFVGARLGRDPGPDFSTESYLDRRPEVRAAELNPLLHYERHGKAEARTTGNVVPQESRADYAVIVHAYHPDCFDDLRQYLGCFPPEVDRYVSYPAGSEHHSEPLIREAFPGAIPIEVTNVGQDVGAFVQVLGQIDRSRYAFYCKIHTKGGNKLPEVWREALLEGTVGTPERVRQFAELFEKDPKLLLGGPRELFLHGPSYLMGNGGHIQHVLSAAGIDFDPAARDWGFFAGTFLWLREEVVDQLLTHVTGADFKAEAVRRDGQLAHAVERLFGILASAMGGRVALASCIDVLAEPEIFEGLPPDMLREKRQMVDVLGEIRDSWIVTRTQQTVDGMRPGLGFSRVAGRAARHKLRQGDYSIITPTGDRTAAFNRCVQMVATQTVQPREWIIVDDGAVPLTDQMRLPDWVTYVRRERKPDDPPHTLSVNVLVALEHVTGDRVLIVEDDDWYSPLYAEYLLPHLEHYNLVGLNTIRYYHLTEATWKHGRPPKHTAFAQSAFNRGHAWEHLLAVCRLNNTEIREKGVVDRYWWQTFDGSKMLLQDHPCLHVGLKGGFGRPGLAEGHKRTDPDYRGDSERSYLPQKIGGDSAYYNRWQKRFRKPYAIYTSVAGGYDNLKEPLAELGNFDFYAFSDTPLEPVTPWEQVPFDEAWDDPVRTAKKPKILPHLYFPDYEWSLWIDANIFMLADLSVFLTTAIEQEATVALFEHPERNTLNGEVTQLCKLRKDEPELIQAQYARYLSEGWDNQLPLYECNFIVRRHNDPDVMRAMTLWWNEIEENSRRDQVSFPYAMWKSGIRPVSLRPKGNSTRNIPEVFYPTKPPHGIITLDDVREQVEAHLGHEINS
ncbi:glycosyltransferase domain-containing protein [Roseovarius sp.]|uniref:glycosyltransferase domain-containing protein n=1 Tax=Roseovarius sp. TaxID=1486281 RepID=UPI0035643731